MKWLLLIACWSVLVGACRGPGTAQAPAALPQSKALFDGRSLAGWRPVIEGQTPGADPQGVFQIVDGALHVYKGWSAGATAPFGYLETEAPYGDYLLRFEFRWGDKKFAPRADKQRDAGLLYHVHGDPKVWPSSVELQVQEGDVGDLFTVGTTVETTVDPNSRKPGDIAEAAFQAADDGGVPHVQGGRGITRVIKTGTFETAGWNAVELEVRGDEALHRVNGKLVLRARVLRAREPGRGYRILDRGRIALQAEGAEILYRNVIIQPLF